jgi:hypothetical protein
LFLVAVEVIGLEIRKSHFWSFNSKVIAVCSWLVECYD